MTEAEREFKLDVKEKKQIGNSAFRKRRHRARPDINRYSRKELQLLNGEVKTYNLNSVILWKEFKMMPSDLQKEYLVLCREHGGTNSVIGQMMGVSSGTVQKRSTALGLPKKQGAIPDYEKWNAWLSEISTDTVSDVHVVETASDVVKPEPESNFRESSSGRLSMTGTFSEIAEALSGLLGNSIKQFVIEFYPADEPNLRHNEIKAN